MVSFINGVAGGLVWGITRPLVGFSQWVPLLWHGFLLGLVALGIYAVASNQKALRRSKSRLLARVLEIRLFRDDPVSVLVAFGHVVGGTVRYLSHSMKPLAFLLPLVVLWIIQLAGWFEWRPLLPGETSLVTVRLKSGVAPQAAPAALHVPDGFVAETPAFRSRNENELVWRVRALRAGSGVLRFDVAGVTVEKGIVAGTALEPLSPARVAGGVWPSLTWPVEAPLGKEGAPVEEIRVEYPRRSWDVWGYSGNWLVVLLVASIGFGLVLKRPLGVEF
jgi:hypothetical protein